MIIRSKRGFTLLEVLAATALAGMALAVIFQLFSSNLRALAVSDGYISAVATADERIRDITNRDDLGERTWTETTEGYRLDCSVSPVLQERTDALPAELYEVVVTLHWNSGSGEKSITLRNMKAAGRRL